MICYFICYLLFLLANTAISQILSHVIQNSYKHKSDAWLTKKHNIKDRYLRSNPAFIESLVKLRINYWPYLWQQFFQILFFKCIWVTMMDRIPIISFNIHHVILLLFHQITLVFNFHTFNFIQLLPAIKINARCIQLYQKVQNALFNQQPPTCQS